MQLFDVHRSIMNFVDEALKAFQALADPTRLAVFQCIRCCGDAGRYTTEGCQCGTDCGCCCCLSEVRSQVACAPSTLTHHLNALREAGLIETERKGREVFVRVAPNGLKMLVGFLEDTPASCDPNLIRKEEITNGKS